MLPLAQEMERMEHTPTMLRSPSPLEIIVDSNRMAGQISVLRCCIQALSFQETSVRDLFMDFQLPGHLRPFLEVCYAIP